MTSEISRRSALAGIVAPCVLLPFAARASMPPGGSVSVRDFGAKGDGVTDDTAALAQAHASGKAVYYPRTAAFYFISRTLAVTTSTSSDGAQIRFIGDGSSAKGILRVPPGAGSLTISGLVLDGGYKGGTQGEWSHGIAVIGAKNVTVTGNTIQNVYGDCVYVGSDNAATLAPAGVRISGNKLTNPRRCNVAVVCGEDVIIDGNSCAKDVDYVAAIDLEPDRNKFDYVRRVHILNNRFVTKKFISAGVNNGVENSGLLITGNSGLALEFFHGWENALLRNVTIMRNRFSAAAPEGVMLNLEVVKGGVVANNIDETPCGSGYHSIKIRDCDLSLKGNKFCA